MRPAWALPVLVLVVLLALLAPGFVTGGGPPAESPQPGVKEWRPRLEAWQLLSADAAEVGTVLCNQARPCDLGALDAAAGRHASCAWTARVWLAAGASMPLVLRDVGGKAYAVVVRGGGELREDNVLNQSLHLAEFPAPWSNGWWWRAEGERVDLAVPVPCDVREVRVSLNYTGLNLLGRERSNVQTVRWQAA